MFLAAIDERVRAAIVSGYLSSWRAAHTMPWNMCGSQIMPGQLGMFEHLDLAALIAPRPLLVESGTDDPIFPLATARAKPLGASRRVYAALGAADDAVQHDVFEGDHQWHGALAPDFLEQIPVTDIDTRLKELGIELPGPYPPHDPLDAIVVHGGRARTSGQLPRNHEGQLVNPGVLGAEVDVAEGAEAARWCALNALSVLRSELGSLDRIDRVLDGARLRGVGTGLPSAAGGHRRREQAPLRRVRRRRPPQSERDRGRRAAAGRRRRDRGRGLAPQLIRGPAEQYGICLMWAGGP